MINIKELRIGNWVKNKTDKGNFQIRDGEDIDDMGISNAYEPIPLTPDILEKAGFKEISKNYFINMDYSMLKDMGGWHFDYVDADSRGQRSIAYPVHIHQLQNLYFALTGEELNINL